MCITSELRATEARCGSSGDLYVLSLPPPIVLKVSASSSILSSTLRSLAHRTTSLGSPTSEPSLPGLKVMLPKLRQSASIA